VLDEEGKLVARSRPGPVSKNSHESTGQIAFNFGSKPVGFQISDCRLQIAVICCAGGAELNGFDGGFSVQCSVFGFQLLCFLFLTPDT